MNPHDIATKVLGPISWKDSIHGFCKCPGEARHTSKTVSSACRVSLDKVPTVFCLHQSCKDDVEKANHDLRFAIWEENVEKEYQPTPEQKQAAKARDERKKFVAKWQEWVLANRENIFKQYAFSKEMLWEQSLIQPKKPEDDFELFLSLWDENDIIWVGDRTDSGLHAKDHFKPAREWLYERPEGNFTTPCTYHDGNFRRANDSVSKRKFLVIESDTMSQDETATLANWLCSLLRLRMVVFSGKKSLHCWYDFPTVKTLEYLQVVLPALGCDPALFKPSQPVRCPGMKRDGIWQNICYFNPTTK